MWLYKQPQVRDLTSSAEIKSLLYYKVVFKASVLSINIHVKGIVGLSNIQDVTIERYFYILGGNRIKDFTIM